MNKFIISHDCLRSCSNALLFKHSLPNNQTAKQKYQKFVWWRCLQLLLLVCVALGVVMLTKKMMNLLVLKYFNQSTSRQKQPTNQLLENHNARTTKTKVVIIGEKYIACCGRKMDWSEQCKVLRAPRRRGKILSIATISLGWQSQRPWIVDWDGVPCLEAQHYQA